MSRDATLSLYAAVRSALIADSIIAGLSVTSVASDWSGNPTPPFMRMSVPTVTRFEDDAGDGSEYTLRVHVFAADVITAGELAAQVREVLQDAELNVSGSFLWWLTYEQTINLRDPDGTDPILNMAVVSFKAVTTN